MSLSSTIFRFLLPLTLLLPSYAVVQEAGEVSTVEVTATKWDVREFELNGCSEIGCYPGLTRDRLDNTTPISRWSCHEVDVIPEGTPCYITYDIGDLFVVEYLTIYFYKSNELDRTQNLFSISTSETNATYTAVLEDSNLAGTELGAGENFTLPRGTVARFVRITGLDMTLNDQWLSINEVKIFVDDAAIVTSTIVPTPAPNINTPAPTTIFSTSTETPMSAPPTQAPEVFSGCIDVTVAGAGTLDGVYTGSGTANGRPSYVSAIGSGQLSSSQALISCSGTDATNCEATQWTLGETSTDYVVYDEATRPEEITEVWLRLTGVSGEPAFVSITCGDGSGTPAPTSAPVVIETTGCETVSVEGTTSLDGIYSVEDPPIYKGYTQDLDGNWIINDNEIGAGITTTSGCDASDPNLVCSFNKWTISTSSGSQSYFTYNDAAHPVDISASALWYIVESHNTLTTPHGEPLSLALSPPSCGKN